jgi:transcription elongation GreA/GreB family factor
MIMRPLISDDDFIALQKAAQTVPISRESPAGTFLKRVLSQAKRVPAEELPPRTVRINSVVQVWHSLLRKMVKLRIVLPDLADLKVRNISVFAPISLALLGRQENDDVTISIGPLKKKLRIIKVINETRF